MTPVLRSIVPLSTSLLLGLLGLGSESRAEKLGVALHTESVAWRYDTRRGESRARQQLYSLETAWRPSDRWRVGLASSVAKAHQSAPIAGAAHRSQDPDPRTALGWSLQWTAPDRRLLLAAGSEFWTESDLRSSEELLVAQTLQELALEFPAPEVGAGSHLSLGLAWQPIVAANWSAQVAAGWEARGAYRLGDLGEELAPGGRLRAGASLRRGWGAFDLRAGLSHIAGADAKIAGQEAYRTGAQSKLRVDASYALVETRLRASVEGSGRASGEVDPDLVLDPALLRAGNRARWSLGADRDWRRWRFGLGVEGSHLRGFAGQLGHVDWIAPTVAVAYSAESSTTTLRLRRASGKTREQEALDGWLLELAWGWGILR